MVCLITKFIWNLTMYFGKQEALVDIALFGMDELKIIWY